MQVRHAVPAQEPLLLKVIALLIVHVFLAPIVIPFMTFLRLLTFVVGLCTPTALKRRAVSAPSFILAKLAIALGLEIRIELVFNGAVGPLNLEEHLLGELVAGVQVRMILLGLVEVCLLHFVEGLFARDSQQEVRVFKLLLRSLSVEGEAPLAALVNKLGSFGAALDIVHPEHGVEVDY